MKNSTILSGTGNYVSISVRFIIGVMLVLLVSLNMASLVHAVDSDSNVPITDESSRQLDQFGYEGTVPDKVWEAAYNGLTPFLKSIPVQDLVHYGFPAGTGFEDISLGKPYRVHTILPEKLLHYSTNQDIRSLVTTTAMWFFPVLQKGEPRTILTVDLMDGEWQAVAIGSSGLMEQLYNMEQRWSDRNNYKRILVRVFQARSDIMLVSDGDELSIAPFGSAIIALGIEKSDPDAIKLYQVPEIMEKLVPVVQENVNQGIK